MKEVTKNLLKEIYKERDLNTHKGDFGKLIIIGGSKKYPGSLTLNILSAMAAYRSGVDIVEIVAPKRAAEIAAKFSPDIITYPLEGDYIEKRHLKILLEQSKGKNSFVIGGGIERKNKTLSTISTYLKKIRIPGVIDADAIYSINSKINLKNFVITPHEREFFILTGKKLTKEFNLKERVKLVKENAKNLNTTILLKGNVDIISNGKEVVINKTGTPYMSVGGTGDVLAGIIGSLIAQGNNLFDSACAGAYINGKAGEFTKRKSSLIASDLIEQISNIVDKV